MHIIWPMTFDHVIRKFNRIFGYSKCTHEPSLKAIQSSLLRYHDHKTIFGYLCIVIDLEPLDFDLMNPKSDQIVGSPKCTYKPSLKNIHLYFEISPLQGVFSVNMHIHVDACVWIDMWPLTLWPYNLIKLGAGLYAHRHKILFSYHSYKFVWTDGQSGGWTTAKHVIGIGMTTILLILEITSIQFLSFTL